MFDPKQYAELQSKCGAADEPSVRFMVEESGGVAGEVETGKSELIYHDHKVVSINRYLPVYHAEDFDRRVPVEMVYLGSEVQTA